MMNMCSKFQKDMILLKQEHAKPAVASSKEVVCRSSRSDESELSLANAVVASIDLASQISQVKSKEGLKKCTACRKRVGLTGSVAKIIQTNTTARLITGMLGDDESLTWGWGWEVPWSLDNPGVMESSKETGCRAPEDPVLYINDYEFFGSAAMMNMCSKFQKDMILLKQEHAKPAVASSKEVVCRSSRSDESELSLANAVVASIDLASQISQVKSKEGLKKCTACRKRVGLTGSVAKIIQTNTTARLITGMLVRMQ
ncbi:hypothetical protein BC332_33397 [Capsicum chinense]|nr:hypothetical protein BC332_33397 [Capsicum chinense]